MQVKICGLSTPESVDTAVNAGAHYLGFVFFPKSPRHVGYAHVAQLVKSVPNHVTTIALTVNADNAMLDALLSDVSINCLQLHGAETPARVAEVKARYGLPIIKAVGVADATDLAQLEKYAQVCDQLLVDAKPPKGYDLPGGNGLAFDWRLIVDREWSVPWLLAGGLTPDNVAEAVRLTGATQVDVSSGVESAPGVKDLDKIAAFIRAAKGAV